MAKLKRPSKKFLAIIIALLIAVGLTGFAFWQNQLDEPFIKLSFLPGYVEPIECGDDAQCLFGAYNDGCHPATLRTAYTTIEGDPIITSSELSKSDDKCLVDISIDSTQDSLAPGGISQFSCQSLSKESLTDDIIASECSGENAYKDMTLAL